MLFDKNILPITKCAKHIFNNNLKQFECTLKPFQTQYEITDHLYKICLQMDKYEFIETMLKRKINPPIKTIFDAVENNQIEYIQILIKHKINLDVLNSDGLTPIECAFHLPHPDIKDIIVILNDQKYVRNPKWWDYVVKTNIYNPKQHNELEEKIYKCILGENISNVMELNHCIVRNMIEFKMFKEIRNFVKSNIKFLNLHQLLQDIKSLHYLQVIDYVDDFFSITDELIIDYLDLQVYEKVLVLNGKFDSKKVIFHLVRKLDERGLIFMFEFIEKDVLSIVDENGNNLLHILCQLENSEKQIQCYKVLMHYCSKLTEHENNDGNIPLFLCFQDSDLVELLLDLKNLPTNKNGDTYLHQVVRFGTPELLKRILLCFKNIKSIINEVNNNHETALVLACKLKRTEMCNILLNYHADVNISDDEGNCIYHYICMYHLSEVHIEHIPETKNNHGLTPFNYVIQSLLV